MALSRIVRHLLIFGVSFVFHQILTPRVFAADGSVLNSFRQNAPKGWEAIESAQFRVDSTAHIHQVDEFKDPRHKPRTKDFELDCRRRAGCLLVALRDSGPGAEAIVKNPRYHFKVARKHSELDGWRLMSFGPCDESFSEGDMFQAFWAFLTPSTSVCVGSSQRLTSLIHDPKMTFDTAEQVGEKVVVAFRYLETIPGTTTPSLCQGRVYFVPKLQWAVSRYDYTSDGGSFEFRLQNNLVEGVSEHPDYVRSSTIETISKGGKSTKEVTFRRATRQANEAEFTLSAFGLPEPAGAPQRGLSWHWGFLLTAVICAIGAVLVRRAALSKKWSPRVESE
jgi:hypothetical protein